MAVSRSAPAETTGRRSVDPERLKTLIEFFPVGKKLRYYPEFKKDIVFDTLMVGYAVNGELLLFQRCGGT